MKTLQVFGWAVIFTVTLLLSAFASHTPEVADTDTMSGPELTMTQAESQKQMIERRENTLVIHDAWLNEREAQLAHGLPDLTRQEEIYTFNQQAWLDEREMLVEGVESRTTSTVKLAGVDSTPAVISPTPIRVEAGRCYARVVYPAEYKTVAVIKPIEVPKGGNLPTLYQSVTEKVKVTDEQMRWEEVLCEDRMTDCRIMEVQRALYRGGYKPGPINGVVGRQTMTAINNFQKDFNLTITDQLTIETVNALDANF